MNKKRKLTIKNNEISEVCEVELGGYKQKIMLDGKSANNTVVICLHGGPGTPVPFSVGCRGMFPEITENVTLVCWDQLGCGINNYPIDDSFSIDTFVNMTVDLAREIRRRFPDNRIYLFGMSWGSILALKTSDIVGNEINGAVTYGQVLHDITFNEAVYCALEKSKLPKKKKQQLQTMKNDKSAGNAARIMEWISKYTNAYNGTDENSAPIGSFILGLLKSPDYKFRDFKAVVINGYMKNTSLIQALTCCDLRNELKNSKIPYTIIQGSEDIVTPTKMIEDYVTVCDNKNVKTVIIPDSGHFPGKKAMKAILNELISL